MIQNKKLKIGIIGAGGIANSVHLPSLCAIGNIEVVSICDIVKEKAEKTAAKFSISHIYSSYFEMIAMQNLDAVFILVQPDQAFRITLDCLKAGLDVFVEKPAGITSYQTDMLLRASMETNKILQVGFNRRYIPLVRHVLQIIKDTTKINQVEGCFFKHADSAFYNGCANAFECDTIHAIDLVRWISGGEAVKAATIEGGENSAAPNSWNSVIRFDNGITGIIKANYQTGARIHTFEIHGPEASAFINIGFGNTACEADILFFNGKGTYSVASTGPGLDKRIHIDGMELAGSKEYYKYYGYYQEDLEFIDSIRSRKRSISDIAEAVKTMYLIDLLKNGKI
jgi:virulence factor